MEGISSVKGGKNSKFFVFAISNSHSFANYRITSVTFTDSIFFDGLKSTENLIFAYIYSWHLIIKALWIFWSILSFDYLSKFGKIHISWNDLMFESLCMISHVIQILGQNFSGINFWGFCKHPWTKFGQLFLSLTQKIGITMLEWRHTKKIPNFQLEQP